MKNFITALAVCKVFSANAQKDSTPSPLTITGYIETYYSYDFNKPQNHTKPSFLYSHNRYNEVNLNLGFVKAAYQTNTVRANLAFSAGTYMNANYAAEPGVLKNIFEASAGIKISKTKNVWIDAGIFPSHIGFESAIGKDCWNVTRSILAENSPYFESGAKVSYTSNDGKWFLSGLVLNGWQRIQRLDGNNTPSFGHQITYKPNNKVTLNSSSFIGNDKPDSTRQMRYFHNFYGIFQLSDKFFITTGFDIGAEQKAKGGSRYNTWYAPILILKISPGSKNNIAARAEYYSDEKNVIIASPLITGFKTWAYSFNYNYSISSNILWRAEARWFKSNDKIFTKANSFTDNNYSIITSLSIAF